MKVESQVLQEMYKCWLSIQASYLKAETLDLDEMLLVEQHQVLGSNKVGNHQEKL